MRITDRIQAGLIHATARFTVRYGDNLRFGGTDLPAPAKVQMPTRHGQVPVFLYRPSGAAVSAVHVHFHGGAWLMRYPQMDDWWCRYLVATADVVAHVARDGAAFGLDPERISVGGFSSGGGLAASVCLQARDAGTARPVLQVLGVPALDLASDISDRAPSMINPSFRELVYFLTENPVRGRAPMEMIAAEIRRASRGSRDGSGSTTAS